MSLFTSIAEQKIREAIARGELDNLTLKGRPIPMEDLSDVPEELRMGYKILKNAGILPEELLLNREILTLKDLLEACRDQQEKEVLRKKLTAKRLHFDLLMERNRKNSGFRRYASRVVEKLGI
ncbi:MAG: DUF1992 domain-containing protein [Desulfuromonadales bacterium]|jgi:hypothetical protein